jgi:hypothetical protein
MCSEFPFLLIQSRLKSYFAIDLPNNPSIIMKPQILLTGFLSLVLLAFPERAVADQIYSNLGTDGTWDHSNAYTINSGFTQAMHFTLTASATLTAIDLPIGYESGTNLFNVQLRANNGGVPGAIIESIALSNLPTAFNEPLAVATSALHPVLTAGTEYWVVVAPGNASTNGVWNWTSPLQTGTHASSADGGSTWTINAFGRTEISAFSIEGTAVAPEPSSTILVASAFATIAFGAWFRLRRKPVAT